MTSSNDLERSLPSILADVGRGPTPDYADAVLSRTAPIAQRPSWTFPERWLPPSVGAGLSNGVWRLPLRTVAAVGLLILVVVTGVALYVGGRPARLPVSSRLFAATGPAANGLIAYDRGGDVYVGDPVTGMTRAIVTGPANDSAPIFSPDGRHIAFLRGTPAAQDVVVVEPDGAAERVITHDPIRQPADSDFINAIAWTPDSGRIVVAQGRSGQLTIQDASGSATPRSLTPPLRAWPRSGDLFDVIAGVASNFRPPLGDKVVATGDIDALRIFDADLQTATQLARSGLERYEHYAVASAAWSPDGSMILFGLRRVNETGSNWYGDLGIFVVDANGSNVRRLADGAYVGGWSPDGTMVAIGSASSSDGAVTILDLASGAERRLIPTDPATGQPVAAIRGWWSPGWSWAPDGRSILFFDERYLPRPSRPLVVDVETGATTELPWESGSTPSWQRLPGD